jgi:hypothetical protein
MKLLNASANVAFQYQLPQKLAENFKRNIQEVDGIDEHIKFTLDSDNILDVTMVTSDMDEEHESAVILKILVEYLTSEELRDINVLKEALNQVHLTIN